MNKLKLSSSCWMNFCANSIGVYGFFIACYIFCKSDFPLSDKKPALLCRAESSAIYRSARSLFNYYYWLPSECCCWRRRSYSIALSLLSKSELTVSTKLIILERFTLRSFSNFANTVSKITLSRLKRSIWSLRTWFWLSASLYFWFALSNLVSIIFIDLLI